jgi:hypothetical protein
MTTPTMSDTRQAAIRTALVDIAAKHGGFLNPHHVVEAARDPGHPLHAEFPWEDATAADAYRLVLAEALIRRVKLAIMRPATDTKPVTVQTTRAYQSRPSQRHKTGGYEAIDVLMADQDKRRELLASVLRDLQAYRKRYAVLEELSGVWRAIDEVRIPDPPIGESSSEHPSSPTL